METKPGRKPRGLTKRQLLFTQLYIKYGNASRAAREAGYSQKTAYSIGHENLSKPAIKTILDEVRARQHEEWLKNMEQRRTHGFARR